MSPILDLDLLRTFVAIVKTGQLKLAAETVSRSQGAVSMQLKRLEEVTGKQLLIRSNQDLKLTQAGIKLLSYSEQLLSLNHQAVQALTVKEEKSHLTFGIPSDYAQDFIRHFMPLLKSELPLLDAKVICDSSRNLRKRVNSEEIDIAIVTGEGAKTSASSLWIEPLVWTAPHGFDLKAYEEIPLASFEQDCMIKDIAKQSMKESKRVFKTSFESPVLENLVAAAEAGLGIALLPASLVNENRLQSLETLSLTQKVISTEIIHSTNLASELVQSISSAFKKAEKKRTSMQ
ncbi:MAG: LysR family transcriptional regulator [Marinomonas sp.]